MKKLKSYVLPIAIVLGVLLHSWCDRFSILVPYIIFSILLLSFSAVDIKRLRMSWLDVWIMAFQILVSIGLYALLKLLGANDIVAQGVLIGVLCPVASSVAVVSTELGANRETVTAYTIFGNLMVCLVAPLYFSFIGTHQEMPFLQSFALIFGHIGAIIGLPFLVAWLLQLLLPKVSHTLAHFSGLAFYLWALALLSTLGKTFHSIFQYGEGNWATIAWLGVAALACCVLQFAVGKAIGHHYGDTIAGGQLLGQKNSAMGIWMAAYYLVPLSAVFLAFYSIYQNLFNSWQLWRHGRKH